MDMATLSGNKPAPIPSNEGERLLALRQYCVVDTPPEPLFDNLTAIGCALFQTPVVLISLVDEHRQFFKSVIGLADRETARDSSFCAYAILADEPLVVLDALQDERFRGNALVVGPPYIRFYAGAPLMDSRGMKLGSFCVISDQPRATFSPADQLLLERLATLTVNAIEQRLYPARIAQAEQALVNANERYRLATRATTDGIWDWDGASGECYYSARLRAIIGLQEEDYVGSLHEWIDRLHPDDGALAISNLDILQRSATPAFESEYRVRHEDGTWRWVHNRGTAVRGSDGKLLRLTGAIADVTAQRVRDDLTGLHSRISLLNAMESRIRHSGPFALLCVDLDQLKRINDSLGHSCGDQLLVEAARRIQQSLGLDSDDVAARITGDEFAILLNHIQKEPDVIDYATRLHALLQSPMLCDSQSVKISASIGIVVTDHKFACPEQAIHDANAAMHRAKSKGNGQTVVFSNDIRERALARLTLEGELRNALAENAVSLHYQPKVVLGTGELIGFEALMRWRHEKKGFIQPTEFIPLAEQSELILEIGRWTLHEALRQLAEWRSAGLAPPNCTMAVNLSAKQFEDEHLAENVRGKLEFFGLPAECLALEVTEGILILDVARALKILNELKAIGVGVDLDDFGTGLFLTCVFATLSLRCTQSRPIFRQFPRRR